MHIFPSSMNNCSKLKLQVCEVTHMMVWTVFPSFLHINTHQVNYWEFSHFFHTSPVLVSAQTTHMQLSHAVNITTNHDRKSWSLVVCHCCGVTIDCIRTNRRVNSLHTHTDVWLLFTQLRVQVLHRHLCILKAYILIPNPVIGKQVNTFYLKVF